MDKALLVGINAYHGAPLQGCINDVDDMAKFIRASCNFTKAAMMRLTNHAATATAILSGLNWLVVNAKPGDRLLFHYSGHGAQVPTRTAGEVDGLDEVICPVDFDWTDKRLIRDKQFHTIFGKIPAGVEFVWISDSCHSGDLSKAELGHAVRTMPVPGHIMADLVKARALPKKTRDATFNGVLISGCKSNQTSADAVFGTRYNGALTHFLLEELNKNPLEPLNHVVPNVVAALKAGGYRQTPCLEGSPSVKDRGFLVSPEKK